MCSRLLPRHISSIWTYKSGCVCVYTALCKYLHAFNLWLCILRVPNTPFLFQFLFSYYCFWNKKVAKTLCWNPNWVNWTDWMWRLKKQMNKNPQNTLRNHGYHRPWEQYCGDAQHEPENESGIRIQPFIRLVSLKQRSPREPFLRVVIFSRWNYARCCVS